MPNDIPFIYSTWLNSMRSDSELGRYTYKSEFFEQYKHVIDRILQSRDVKVNVVSIIEEPSTIISYCVFEPQVIHYVFTKSAHRRKGHMTRLMVDCTHPKQCTALTHRAIPIVQSKNISYNPHYLWSKHE